MAHILIVDDDASIQDLIRDSLSLQGHVFDTASNGREALRQIRATSYDLVILDRGMPEIDGLQVLKVLRSSAETAGLKVIMCTAASMMVDADEAFAAGASDYVVKPLDFVKLSAKVAALTRPA